LGQVEPCWPGRRPCSPGRPAGGLRPRPGPASGLAAAAGGHRL